MLAHLRTEAYPVYSRHYYPPATADAAALSYERNTQLIEQSKDQLGREDAGTAVPKVSRSREDSSSRA
jgi:hypothetical protein